MHDRVVPGQLKETQDLSHPLFRVKNQLFIDNWQAVLWSQLVTLLIHSSDGRVPLLQALSVAFQVETSYSHFPGYNAVNSCPAISYHKEELAIGKQLGEEN